MEIELGGRMEKRTSEILEEALALIERPGGWIKRVQLGLRPGYEPGAGVEGYAMCAFGAVAAVVDGYGFGVPHHHAISYIDTVAVQRAQHIVRRHLDPVVAGVPGHKQRNTVGYNDLSRTNKRDIIAVFQAAIRNAKATEGQPLDVPSPEQEQQHEGEPVLTTA